MNYKIYHKDNLEFLQNEEKKKYSLIYIDPPFNTGKKRSKNDSYYNDSFFDYISFLSNRLSEAWRVLKENGSIFIHLDFREVHYIKIKMDEIFGRENFQNEIVWTYDYGGRSKKRWPAKHDNILWYSKNPKNYIFHYNAIDRIPYLSPGLVGKKKAEQGKTLTDTWWNTIVPTQSKEKVNYPTQKPLAILERIVKVHSNENDLLLDFFAGSGSFGEAALLNHRNVVLVDENEQAIKVMQNRLSKFD